MTVSTTASKIAYTGNGVTTAYSFPYPFIASSDLQVYVAGVLKTLTTDYTVSGSAPYPSGANVTFLSAPANGAAILIRRTRPYTQTLDLVENDPLPADQVELSFDSLVMLTQQLLETLSRAPLLAITSLQNNITLADLIAGCVPVVNAGATGFDMGPTATQISNAQGYATAAAASASAASTSASSAATSAAVAAAAATGMQYRQARVASTANVNIASAPSSLDSIAGVANDRWLLKNQTAPAENGLYQFNGTGSALTRTFDMDTWAEVPGITVIVTEGSTNADVVFLCTSDAGGTLGTTAITFVNWSSTIVAGSVTNAMLANMAAATIKGSVAGGTPADLTATQATSILNAVVGDSGSGGTKGLVPAPAAGDAAANKFLRASGVWSAIAEALLTFTDIATNNASTSNHGFLKKLSNVATQYMDGTGNWSTPVGLPPAVVGVLSGANTTFTLDFTTYSEYLITIASVVSSSNDIEVDVSKDAFSTTAVNANAYKILASSTFSSSNGTNGQICPNTQGNCDVSFVLSQPSTSGNAFLSGTVVDKGTGAIFTICKVDYTLTAAINRIKFTTAGTFSGGSVICQPISAR